MGEPIGRVVVIEDERPVRDAVLAALRAERFAATGFEDLPRPADVLGVAPDLAILDVLLPSGSGFALARSLREQHELPIIFLTARDAVADRVAGLELGADDYLVKPFALEELVARLEALLRRPGQLLGRSLALANLVFDTESRQAFIDDKPQTLSAREGAVLELLMRRKGRVVSKKLVEDQIFGLSGEVASNAVEVYVHRLRKQLAEHGAKVEIHTVRGVGYIMAEEKLA